MRGSVYIEKRKLPPSKKHPKGRTRYYVFSEVNGERISHGGHDRLRDAKATKRTLDGQLADGTFGKPERKNPLYNNFFAEWWESKKKSITESTIRAYESSFRLYVLPFFKRKHVASITPKDVQDFVDSLDHLSGEYVRTIYSHFRACINTALDRDIIDRTPCRRIILPKRTHKRKNYLGPTDVWKLIMGGIPPYPMLFAILALSGIRIGECLALKVRSIKFEEGKIRIEETWGINTRALHEPKSPASIRDVQMIDCLSEILADYLKETGKEDPEEFIFPSPSVKGQPLSYNSVNGVFHRTRERLGLAKCNIHSLRHSFSSIMLAAGVAIPTISRNLGHSGPEVTMKVYAHEIDEMVGPALEKADELFRAARESLSDH